MCNFHHLCLDSACHTLNTKAIGNKLSRIRLQLHILLQTETGSITFLLAEGKKAGVIKLICLVCLVCCCEDCAGVLLETVERANRQ